MGILKIAFSLEAQMPNYRRTYIPGSTVFLTIVTFNKYRWWAVPTLLVCFICFCRLAVLWLWLGFASVGWALPTG